MPFLRCLHPHPRQPFLDRAYVFPLHSRSHIIQLCRNAVRDSTPLCTTLVAEARRCTYAMDYTMPCSITWFRVFMRLSGSDVVSTVAPNELMPSRFALSQFWGVKTGSGYVFQNHGNVEYEAYVRELFSRTLQLRWPLNSVLPFQFARALVAEAMEIDVNWVEFAFTQTHPHRHNSGLYRLLPEFTDLSQPLPPLNKIIPFINFKVGEGLKIFKLRSFPFCTFVGLNMRIGSSISLMIASMLTLTLLSRVSWKCIHRSYHEPKRCDSPETYAGSSIVECSCCTCPKCLCFIESRNHGTNVHGCFLTISI